MTADNAPKPAAPGYEDSEELFRLFQRYRTGDGVEADKTKAVEYYRKAAALGSEEAKFYLELMHEI